MKDLRGDNAILTGASRGLGIYVAKALAARGANVTLAARSTDKLEETRRACEALGVRAIAVATDVTSRDDLQRLVETSERELGPTDILVNNAGIETSAALTDHNFEQIDAVVRTNLSGPIWLTRMVLPGMLARRKGAIVNMASLAGKGPTPYGTIYAATKHGLVGFTHSLRLEIDGSGVTAGVVCPGFVSEAGMWADNKGKAPFMMREVPPQKVAAAVLKTIEGSPEMILTAGPIRPLLALIALAPSVQNPLVKLLRVPQTLRKQAELRREEHLREAAALSRDRG